MDSYEQEVKRLSAKAMADLQAELAREPAGNTDTLRNERTAFQMQLIKARQRQKLSQAELAKKLGLPQSAIARVEGKHGNPSLKTLLAIAKALEVNLVLE